MTAGDQERRAPGKSTPSPEFLELVRAIAIRRPPEGAAVYDSRVLVEGTIAYDGEVSKVRVNGEDAPYANSRFQTVVEGLRDGGQAITVDVESRDGVRASSSVRVSVDVTAPAIELDSPREGEECDREVRVAGRAVDASRVVVHVNGKIVPTEIRGEFETVVELPSGEHVVEVRATDPGRRSATVRRKVRVRGEPSSGEGA